MHIFSVMVLSMFLVLQAGDAQESHKTDPYSVDLIRAALKARSQGMIIATIQKQLTRKGDAAAIGILKLLNVNDLADPNAIKGILPIVRDAFSQPTLISIESDKQPQVTFFLLRGLQRNTEDVRLKREIQQTIDFIQKTIEQNNAFPAR